MNDQWFQQWWFPLIVLLVQIGLWGEIVTRIASRRKGKSL